MIPVGCHWHFRPSRIPCQACGCLNSLGDVLNLAIRIEPSPSTSAMMLSLLCELDSAGQDPSTSLRLFRRCFMKQSSARSYVRVAQTNFDALYITNCGRRYPLDHGMICLTPLYKYGLHYCHYYHIGIGAIASACER
jgi:hypothetical protein